MYARCCAAAVALTEGAAVTAKPAGPVPNAICLPPNSICPSSLAPSRAECTGNASTDDASARPATLAPLVKHVSLLSRPSLVVFFPSLSLHLWIAFGLFTPTSPWPTISWLLMEEFPFFPPPTAVTSQHKDEEIRERKAKKKNHSTQKMEGNLLENVICCGPVERSQPVRGPIREMETFISSFQYCQQG